MAFTSIFEHVSSEFIFEFILASSEHFRNNPSMRGQGWITSAHVRDFMARAGANGLGTLTNIEKMAI